jgi:hypothetical protein
VCVTCYLCNLHHATTLVCVCVCVCMLVTCVSVGQTELPVNSYIARLPNAQLCWCVAIRSTKQDVFAIKCHARDKKNVHACDQYATFKTSVTLPRVCDGAHVVVCQSGGFG